VDVWGRFRNRAFYGDSLYHSVTGSDSSITQGLIASRNNLAALVGSERLSPTFIAPEFDYSPKQMRVGQNHNQLDSLMWSVRAGGGSALIVFTKGRDMDPQYNKTNPVGFLDRERVHTITTASKAGQQVKLLGVTASPVYGSAKFINASVTDTVPPYCNPTCPGPNVAVAHESRFWNGFFPTSARDYQFDSYDNFVSDQGIYLDSRDRLYGQSRASVCVLPAQLFGGGQLDYGYGHIPNAQTYPAMQGWLIFKHIANVAKAANRIAGRKIIDIAYPEDIEP
jgi:hypothetical protein